MKMVWRRNIALAVAIVVPLALAMLLWSYPPLLSSESQKEGIAQNVLMLSGGGYGEQSFVAQGETIEGVGVIVAKAGVTSGTVEVSLVAPDGTVHGTKNGRPAIASISSLSDWQNVVFRLDPVRTRSGDRYLLRVRASAEVGLAASAGDTYEEGSAAIEGEPRPFDLLFRVYRRPGLQDVGLQTPTGGAAPAFGALSAAVLSLGFALYSILMLPSAPGGGGGDPIRESAGGEAMDVPSETSGSGVGDR